MNANALLQLPCQDRTRSRDLLSKSHSKQVPIPLQKTDHVKKKKSWLHQRLCEMESRAHSEAGTEIVVILHKTLDLKFYKENAGIHVA